MVATRRAQSPAPPTSVTPNDKVDNKKSGLVATYLTLSSRYPYAVNATQSSVIAMASAITASIITSGSMPALAPVLEQGFLSFVLISPIVTTWIPILVSMKLHWVVATAVDQFLFSPVFNVVIFFFISAFLKGGVSLAMPYDAKESVLSLTLSLRLATFPAVFAYEPIFSTLVKAYAVWLPSTLIRETLIPPSFVPLWINFTAFVWNIIFSMILAAS